MVRMDIRAEPDRGHSKVISLRIAEHIGADPDRFAVLMPCLLRDTPRIVQRAAWPMGMVCEAHSELATPWMSTMLDLLDEPVHEAVHRNIVRTFQFCALPKKHHARLTELMFAWIADARKPFAPRASAITVALRSVKLYTELADEPHLLLEDILRDDPGPAIRPRASKALKELSRSVGTR